MNHCTRDAAIIIDADLQDPPEAIKDLIEKWKEGYEVAFMLYDHKEKVNHFLRKY